MGENEEPDEELPILPYDDKRAGKSSGWSGSDTSRERAEHDDSTGVTSKRQRQTLLLLERARVRGLTWRELADSAGLHHGQASSVLSNLHAGGRVVRLAMRRDRSHPYVLPEWVLGRETQPFRNKKASLADAWRAGFVAGMEYIEHGSEAPENPFS